MILYSVLKKKWAQKGFTFVELILTMSLLGFLSVTSVVYIAQVLDEQNFEHTLQELKVLRIALVGNSNRVHGKFRSSFGYLGDIGTIPTGGQTLSSLVSKPVGHIDWNVNSTARFGLGWNGPYLNIDLSEGIDFNDGWGNSYIYSPASTPPFIRSLGSDGALGGVGFAQDITYQISARLEKASVYGFILDGGAPWSGFAEVEINYPNGSGGLQQVIVNVVPGDNGYFSLANVPLGVRSATIYVPSKALATTTVGPFVFTIDKNHIVIPVQLTDVALYEGAKDQKLLLSFNAN